ncbi:MAG: class B sortase [Eubacterium sp.]|nr:class B sortase [Eubacterium sp.]
MSENSNENNKKRGLIILALFLIAFGAAFTGFQLYSMYAEKQKAPETTTVTVTVTESATEKSVKNPVDFNELQKQNPEIYAWLKVPGTKVDHPVVQSAVSDDFYLKHSAYDKSWSSSGAVYTQMCNTKSFKDRVTLIYGHNGYGDTMFTTLHNFEDSEFFARHRYFYIFTPDSKRTYKIVSAFKYDDRHIMNSFDFQDNTVFGDFLYMLGNPYSTVKNVAEDLDKPLNTSDKIVILSTCITYQPNNRYLVCGVLVKNEKTD